MPTEIDKINSKLDEVLQENKRILFYLYNDDRTNTKGLVQQVRDIADEVGKIKDKMMISAAKRAVWNTVFGAIGGGLLWLIKTILTR